MQGTLLKTNRNRRMCPWLGIGVLCAVCHPGPSQAQPAATDKMLAPQWIKLTINAIDGIGDSRPSLAEMEIFQAKK